MRHVQGLYFFLVFSFIISPQILVEWQDGICYNADRQKDMTVPCERRMNPQTVVTYSLGILLFFASDLIQIGIFICALVGLCHTIFKGKRNSHQYLQ